MGDGSNRHHRLLTTRAVTDQRVLHRTGFCGHRNRDNQLVDHAGTAIAAPASNARGLSQLQYLLCAGAGDVGIPAADQEHVADADGG